VVDRSYLVTARQNPSAAELRAAVEALLAVDVPQAGIVRYFFAREKSELLAAEPIHWDDRESPASYLRAYEKATLRKSSWCVQVIAMHGFVRALVARAPGRFEVAWERVRPGRAIGSAWA